MQLIILFDNTIGNFVCTFTCFRRQVLIPNTRPVLFLFINGWVAATCVLKNKKFKSKGHEWIVFVSLLMDIFNLPGLKCEVVEMLSVDIHLLSIRVWSLTISTQCIQKDENVYSMSPYSFKFSSWSPASQLKIAEKIRSEAFIIIPGDTCSTFAHSILICIIQI